MAKNIIYLIKAYTCQISLRDKTMLLSFKSQVYKSFITNTDLSLSNKCHKYHLIISCHVII